ncbi:hypothetical protein SADO_08092 [Salinisphaera dokdonensis CL-ES53]|uniref:Methyltransferase FkbM domain-containing protein n=1 Tax=Salinisphaera dokdonensis CL-ES53 TaxID=1304272 RepID=A0ABV2AZY8_9GAMM
MTPRAALGLWRSLIIYYAQPWRTIALRRFYRALIAPGDRAFDIGAHVGHRSRALAAAGAQVVGVEPQPVFSDFLARRVACESITTRAVALGSAPGRATLHVSSRHPTVSTLSSRWIDQVTHRPGFRQVRWQDRVEVEVSTLDALIAEFGVPHFCKIDVEGLEAEILDGLSQPIALVAFEYNPATPDIARACIARLETLGRYRFNRVVGESHRFYHADWIDADAMRTELANLSDTRAPGDIYARLSDTVDG